MRLHVALLLLLAVLFAAGCGGGEETAPLPETVEGTVEGGETTTQAETETETQPAGGGEGDAEAGAEVFASAGCGGCHVLEAAGSSGTVGPNLDESQPDHELVVDRVTNGMGAMPSFKDQLSEQQIQDVAAYVVASTS
ncbi:MAG: c-type cytochrome [Actinomycetota bacterium]|nr:c-type cytochrome [Actinomycetota bacterium]